MPIGYKTEHRLTVWLAASVYIFNPSFAADLFFAFPAETRGHRSTGSKQTLNGLFICDTWEPSARSLGSQMINQYTIQRYFFPFGSL